MEFLSRSLDDGPVTLFTTPASTSNIPQETPKLRRYRKELVQLQDHLNAQGVVKSGDLSTFDHHVVNLMIRQKEFELKRLKARIDQQATRKYITQMEGVLEETRQADPDVLAQDAPRPRTQEEAVRNKDRKIAVCREMIQKSWTKVAALADEITATVLESQNVEREFEDDLQKYEWIDPRIMGGVGELSCERLANVEMELRTISTELEE